MEHAGEDRARRLADLAGSRCFALRLSFVGRQFVCVGAATQRELADAYEWLSTLDGVIPFTPSVDVDCKNTVGRSVQRREILGVSHNCPVRSCDEKIDTALCERHRRRAAASLAELPRYYVHLALAMVPGTSSSSDKISGSRTPPLPINVTTRALQEDMCRTVRNLEIEYRKFKAWTLVRRRGRESVVLDAGVGFLCRHFDGLIETSFGGDGALDIMRIVSATRSTLGLDRLVHRLPAPCPTCDCLALERESGADRVRCRQCGREFTEDEYSRLVLILASGA